MTSSIRLRLYALAALMIALMLALGINARFGLSAAKDGTKNILLANRTLRNHIEGDMMHDALRADVLAALLAGSPSEFQEVTTGLRDHASKFRAFIEANDQLVSNAGLRAALGEVGPAIDRYIVSAETIVTAAQTNKNKPRRCCRIFW